MGNILKKLAKKIAMKHYIKILHKLKDDNSVSDYLYDYSIFARDQTHDEHVYHFSENIDITICYSVPLIREITGKEHETYMSFKELKELLNYDVEQSREEFDAIRTLVVRRQKHNSPSLIIMYHVPNGNWLLLDGRHRFVEYEKFQPDAKRVPVLVVDSEMLPRTILNKSGFIAYCVQHNAHILENYPIWLWRKKVLKIQYLL